MILAAVEADVFVCPSASVSAANFLVFFPRLSSPQTDPLLYFPPLRNESSLFENSSGNVIAGRNRGCPSERTGPEEGVGVLHWGASINAAHMFV